MEIWEKKLQNSEFQEFINSEILNITSILDKWLQLRLPIIGELFRILEIYLLIFSSQAYLSDFIIEIIIFLFHYTS